MAVRSFKNPISTAFCAADYPFMRISRCLLVAACLLLSITTGHAQKVIVRNNLAYDAALTPNLGVELRFDSAHWAVGLNAGLRPWAWKSGSISGVCKRLFFNDFRFPYKS